MQFTINRLIGIFGGTFNPIHFGHLRMAQELASALNLSEVRFIPSANPPHKVAPEVSAAHRAEMVKLAIADNPKFKLDTRELERTGASYTIDTLTSLREELGEKTSLCLIMGSDAFVKLNTWYRWQALLDYAHIVLVQRPSATPQAKLPPELELLLHDHYTENVSDLQTKSASYIHMQAISMQDISATQIRNLLAHGQSARYLLPEEVMGYIVRQQLYNTAPAEKD